MDEIESKGWDWHMVALVHDAITLDVPAKEVEGGAELLERKLTETAARYFPELPFATDANWGKTWAETS